MNRLRKHRHSDELGEPEILPMMNVLFMLVMVLMGMSAFLPIGVISVQAPQLGGESTGGEEKPTRPELNLTIMILKTGINLSVAGSMLKGAEGPLFPKAKNYDFKALQARLEQIKQSYPEDRAVLIMADPDIIYDDITHIMDAARISSTGKLMFDEVAFVPGAVQ